MAFRALTIIAILTIAGIYSRVLASPPVFALQNPGFESLPKQLDGWSSEDIPMADDIARVLAADETLSRLYQDGRGRVVLVFLAYFATQEVNSQIHSPRNCVPGSGWKILSVDEVTDNTIGGAHGATRMVIGRNNLRHEMLYWFRTRGGDLSGEYGLKLDLIKNAVARRPTNAVFIRFVAPAGQETAMKEVMSHLSGPLEVALKRAGL